MIGLASLQSTLLTRSLLLSTLALFFFAPHALLLWIPASTPGGLIWSQTQAYSDIHERAKATPSNELIDWMRNDDIAWNATIAADILLDRLEDPSQHEEIVRLLESHLTSEDYQLHQFAVGTLQRATSMTLPGVYQTEPSVQLLEETVDFVIGYDFVHWPNWIAGMADDHSSALFLLRHIDRARPFLIDKLKRVEKNKRFIYAFLLAYSGSIVSLDLVMPPLLGALRNNHNEHDAVMSLTALYQLGRGIERRLEDALARSDDEQQQKCLELLLLEFYDPAETIEEGDQRARDLKLKLVCTLHNPLDWVYEQGSR